MSQAVATRNDTNVATIENWVENENIKKKFQEVLDKGAGAFVTSLLSLVKSSPQLTAADPKTVISAAMTAATLKLPINPNLGFAYIIPYGKEAQFQMGWKGYVQLAMRTGQYKTITAPVVYVGHIKYIFFVTVDIVRGKKKERQGRRLRRLFRAHQRILQDRLHELRGHAAARADVLKELLPLLKRMENELRRDGAQDGD